jgi:hypothetical protein
MLTKWLPVIVTAGATILTALFSPSFITTHPVLFAVLNGLAQLLHAVLPSTVSGPPVGTATRTMMLMTLLMALLCVPVTVLAQVSPITPPSAFPETTVTLNLSPITLPGLTNTVAGAETDVLISPSPNLSFGESTLASSSMIFAGGRANYVIMPVSTWIQNNSPNLNGYQFQFYVTASLGVVKPVGVSGNPHWGERSGVGLNYAINGQWGAGFDAEWGNFVGVQRNTWTLAFGPNFHF